MIVFRQILFFNFCQELLNKYENDDRVMMIGGNNFQDGIKRTEYSYFFSKYPHTWGWATWKRAWKYYDFDMKTWPEFKKSGMMKLICENKREEKYWTKEFDRAFKDNKDIWDYQWLCTIWSHKGLCAYPEVNLISNIGHGPEAIHCKNPKDPRANLPAEDIWEIEHPPSIASNREADIYTFDHVFGGRPLVGNIAFLFRKKKGEGFCRNYPSS